MLSSYIKLALRNLAKHRLYAFINIMGLALGLTIFLFSSILVSYENNHDSMFSQRERIFTVGSIFAPTSGEAVRELPDVRTAYGPLFKAEIADAEQVARAIFSERLLTTAANDSYYTGIRFADNGFTRIFDFQYIHGDKTAIDDPRGLIITAATATKLFGRVAVLGEVITLEHKFDLHVAAVIEDVAADSHFNSSFVPDIEIAAIASTEALAGISDFKMEGEWLGLSGQDFTYILLPEKRNRAWLQDQVDAVYARHTPAAEREAISTLKVRPLVEAHNAIWNALGFPVLETVRLLGLLVLIIACVNYTNLAAAQSFSRGREVGLRKTFGAERPQLLTQFLLESLTLAACAMLLAVASIEILVPAYNGWTGKTVTLAYMNILPWLLLTTLAVGLLAGAYPAYLIARLSPIDSLSNTFLKSGKGSTFRGLMIAAQFSISIFMLALVMIIYFQNEKFEESGNIFPKSRIVLLDGVGIDSIRQKYATLRQELNALAGVQAVAFSSEVPFEQATRAREVTPIKGDEAQGFDISIVYVDAEFMQAYDIELLAGRSLDRNIGNDTFKEGVEQVNVVVNQLAAQKLGFAGSGRNDVDVIGKSFYKIPGERLPQAQEYTIVGLMEDNNFNGSFNEMKPTVFYMRPDAYNWTSIRISGQNLKQKLSAIDAVWERVIDDYPIQRSFLDDMFNMVFRIFQLLNSVIAAFAGVALLLALIGLFGLAAFMAQRRTKEIGIRKVMGASVSQIARLLIWQFSLPVLWSLLVAVPLAWLASSLYLDFFAERIGFVMPVIMLASVVGILTAWAIVAGHAVNIARATPIRSLRYE